MITEFNCSDMTLTLLRLLEIKGIIFVLIFLNIYIFWNIQERERRTRTFWKGNGNIFSQEHQVGSGTETFFKKFI